MAEDNPATLADALTDFWPIPCEPRRAEPFDRSGRRLSKSAFAPLQRPLYGHVLRVTSESAQI
jgi:hypothetical protein